MRFPCLSPRFVGKRKRVAAVTINSRTRASKLRGVVCPTFSPKPRKMPRMLSSTSRSLLCSNLRPTSNARTSWASADFRCTGRNQPIRSSCAMPRASLRSVLTTIADSAALTCRVSSRTASKPAPLRPACSHCDNGPASSPIRVTAKPSPPNQATSASGSLATFASRTIRPAASTTQMLLSFSDTSIPAKCSMAVPR